MREYEKKVARAIRLLQSIPQDGEIEVSYSGGKDSDVILELAKMAGINYRAIYKNTTIDPPGTIRHCREKGVEILHPKESFFQLVERKGLPTRRARFCCSELKEYKVADIKGTGDPRVRKADRQWIYTLTKASKAMHSHLEGVRKQYNHYVMPIFNKVFFDREVGKYDVEMYDDHQSDAMELAHLVLRYFDVAFLKKENADAVIQLMQTMDSNGVMEEKDFNHYNFRR